MSPEAPSAIELASAVTARIEFAGESSLIVYLGDRSSPEVSARVQALAQKLETALGDMLIDLIPSYASLLVLYDALRTDHYHIGRCIRDAASDLQSVEIGAGALIDIPVFYHPDCGEDIESLGSKTGLSWEEVAALHTSQEYRVYAIGFAPGFAYLGDVDERIAAPRLATPRLQVPRGAVAIADRQTAVYPAVSPGGWNLIGRSPLRMFDADAKPPMPVAVGDRVRFVPIDRSEFLARGGEI
ncbi:MAG: 5-oxoprolinase subunit PxpB [Congregibacter sp.]